MKKIKSSLNIFKVNSNSSSEDKRFKFLDGYRGSLAIIVIVAHSTTFLDTKCQLIRMLASGAQRYSMSGFFVLSAFLLTHRLLDEFERAEGQRHLLLITLKYATRRFCRIYVVFVLAAVLSKYGPPRIGGYFHGHFGNIFKILLLNHVGYNHLWSIPPEIKFYFCIPLLCLIVRYKSNRRSLGFLLAWILWSVYDQFFNFFWLSTEDVQIGETYHHLEHHFAVFILGFQVALAYYLTQKLAPNFNEYIIRRPYLHLAFDLASLAIGLVGVKTQFECFNPKIVYTFRSRPAVFWSLTLFLCLLGAPNKVTRFFANSDFLCSCGKYSFGMYLFNAGSIMFMREFEFGTEIEYTMACVGFAYVVGVVWFYAVENPMMNVANLLCKKLESYEYFEARKFSLKITYPDIENI